VFTKQKIIYRIYKASYYKLSELDYGREVPINNSLQRCKGGEVHLRVHTGNLSKGILEPCSIRVGDILDELRLSLVEELDLLGKLTLHATKLDLLLGGPLLQFGHLGLFPLCLLLHVNHLISQRQDLCLQLKGLLTLVEEELLGLFLRLTQAAQLLVQGCFAVGKDLSLESKFPFILAFAWLTKAMKLTRNSSRLWPMRSLNRSQSLHRLHRLILLEAFEGLLEYEGELKGRTHLVTPKNALPTTFKRKEPARKEMLGDCP